MGLFDDVGKKFTETGSNAIQKTKDMAETVRINNLISREQSVIDGAYREIGRIYFEKFGSNPDESLEQYIASIQEANGHIQMYRQKLDQLKGNTRCPNCGAEIDIRSKFCNVCGSEVVSQPSNQQDVDPDTNAEICANCGATMKPGNIFCTNCGAKQEQ
jgi:rubrerythrin